MDYKINKIIDITHKLTKQVVFLMKYNSINIQRVEYTLIEEGSDLEKKRIINGGKGSNVGNLASKDTPNTFEKENIPRKKHIYYR